MYSYTGVLESSTRASWRIEDVLPPSQHFDFSRAFLPEALSHTGQLGLSGEGRRELNQIRAYSYLCSFGLVEEFILPFVLDHVNTLVHEPSPRTRALLRFAEEEAKHIELFRLFAQRFTADFGSKCEVIGPADAIGRAVLSKSPFGVVLAVLHIEWMTQQHYLSSVKNNDDLEPTFKELLRCHWMEEAQHAKIDTLLTHELAQALSPRERAAGFAEYVQILDMFDQGFSTQVDFDLASLARRDIIVRDEKHFRAVQHQSYRDVFLLSGIDHARFRETVNELVPDADLTTLARRYN